ncbi:MAG: disulfide bond formation protein B [Parvularcula sp.]|jgi:disulfide bond formation protein DsbB|nr:disulfide bond formation protein B [Parvularcula sp.]
MATVLVNVSRPPVAVGLCVVVSALLLAGAHAFEKFGGLAPCLLCLDQREAHWAALAAGGLALAVAWLNRRSTRLLAASLGVLAILYAFSAGLAGYHAGVEWGFWAGPAQCASGNVENLATADDLLASLNEPAPGPACSEAAWRMAGISMAGYNALISLGLAGLALMSCMRAARSLKRERVRCGPLEA